MAKRNDPWKYVHVDPDRIKNNPFLNSKTPPPPPPGGSETITGQYILMPQTYTYAKGVHALREACEQDANSVQAHPQFILDNGSSIYRPLTFRETIEARVNDYESNKPSDERLRLFNHWINSCVGVAYKAKSTKFKLWNECPALIDIAANFNDAFLQHKYRRAQGIELDSSESGVKYNTSLSQSEVNHHEAWINAIGDDQDGRKLLETYARIVFTELKQKYNRTSGMGFYVRQNTAKDELRALFVNDINFNSIAYGNDYLDNDGSFLRVCSEGTSKNP